MKIVIEASGNLSEDGASEDVRVLFLENDGETIIEDMTFNPKDRATYVDVMNKVFDAINEGQIA